MKSTIKLAATGLVVLALAGCLDSSGGSASNVSQTPPPAVSVDFSTFVRSEFANTDPNREPTKVNNITFTFNDQDNPQAFDDLLR
ncbi:MAG: hypothetical protein V7760_02040 [Marinobacter sp.]